MNQLNLPNFEGRFLISDLCECLKSYLPEAGIKQVYNAYLFAAEAHDGQTRRSGEAYVYHPVMVTGILSGMRLDAPTLTAAMLHDVIEDTPVTQDQVAEEFGQQVADLVDAVSKFKSLKKSEAHQKERKAATFHKMFMAMTRDVRVILIKLADRLHNMRTIGFKKPASRRRIARETLEIYTPIADKLCLGKLRTELEDLSFQALYPRRYRIIKHCLQQHAQRYQDSLKQIQQSLENRLNSVQIDVKVRLLAHPPYQTYRLMHCLISHKQSHHELESLEQLRGMFCFRLVVKEIDHCYRVMGQIHNLYKPKPQGIRDHIAIPKPNQYRGLHSRLIGTKNLHILEVQMLTEDMDDFAEFGIVNQNVYQSINQGKQRSHASEWMRGLQDLGDNTDGAQDFMEHVKINLFPDEVYVFTPKGDIIELPQDATLIDFAYAIHTDIGNHLVAAKIDNVWTNHVRTRLKSGQRIEVRTAKWTTPKPEWLNFAVTAKARSHIRYYLNHLNKETAINLGLRLLDNSLSAYQLTTQQLTPAQCQQLLQKFECKKLEDLHAEIGLGKQSAYLVAKQLNLSIDQSPHQQTDHEARKAPRLPLLIHGTEGMLVSLAKCCQPLPGDPIHGYLVGGRGLVIHTLYCHNHKKQKQDDWLALSWASKVKKEFTVDLQIEVNDQHGSLGQVATTLGNLGVNIDKLDVEALDGIHSLLNTRIKVQHSQQLQNVMRQLQALSSVHDTRRKQVSS